MPRRKYDWRVWLTLTSKGGGGTVQPGNPGKPFWVYLWWRLKLWEAANCATKSLELNLSSEIQSLKDSKCQYPGVKRSLPCVRNKKDSVARTWCGGACDYGDLSLLWFCYLTQQKKLVHWLREPQKGAFPSRPSLSHKPSKIGEFLWLVGKRKSGTPMSPIAGFADGGPQRRNGGMWQSLRNRVAPADSQQEDRDLHQQPQGKWIL